MLHQFFYKKKKTIAKWVITQHLFVFQEIPLLWNYFCNEKRNTYKHQTFSFFG